MIRVERLDLEHVVDRARVLLASGNMAGEAVAGWVVLVALRSNAAVNTGLVVTMMDSGM